MHLRQLGMSGKTIARALGVTDKTVAKAVDAAVRPIDSA
jgi:transposase